MKGWSHIPLILGRIRPSKRLPSTQVLSQCAATREGTVHMLVFLLKWLCTFEMLIPEAGVKLPLWLNDYIARSSDVRPFQYCFGSTRCCHLSCTRIAVHPLPVRMSLINLITFISIWRPPITSTKLSSPKISGQYCSTMQWLVHGFNWPGRRCWIALADSFIA